MNLINKKWCKFGDFKIYHKNNKMIIENKSNKHGFLILPRLYKYKNNEEYRVIFKGTSIKGNAPTLKLINRKKTVQCVIEFNTESVMSYQNLKYYLLLLYVPENSKFEINELIYDQDTENILKKFDNHFQNDTLIITPGYPTDSNKYNTAFVHTRVLNYQKQGLSVDVLVVNSLPGKWLYTFEGVEVLKTDFYNMREILSKKKYQKILIHFFDMNYGNVLDSVDLTQTNLYLYLHGAEVLYKDLPKFASNYFEKEMILNYTEEEIFKRDYYFKKYNKLPNVKWMIVSEFVKNRAEELLNMKFNNYEIIPCYIDQEFFQYQKKDKELRKKVFILRKFSNDSCYAIDIDVRAIIELSHRACFQDLEFDIYGAGEMFDILTEPLKNFSNVKLHQSFYTHEEIKKIHEEHGIGLFATRFDTQGVSLCEAASSGCAIVTSNIETVSKYIDPKLGVTCEVEDYKQYANVIEKMYNDPEYFELVSSNVSKSVKDKFSYNNTLKKELDIFKKEKLPTLEIKTIKSEPVLTVIVPSYNVDKYLWNGVISLINHKNNNKLEILIVDDGSKDNTSKIGKKLEELTTVNNKSIVRLISKENGGHGSTINVGIAEAKGKYIKIMDGDDTLDSVNFEQFISILEKEDSDIVLNNYIEDYANQNEINLIEPYTFMQPGTKYNFDDLCYKNYGFTTWGPILSCSTYKTQMLRDAQFKLSEKSFYVDMELNTYISIACKTIVYYPLFIYRYLLGRANQSVAKASYMRNYKHHENVTINIINILEKEKDNISQVRKNYIKDRLIFVMIKTQYLITIEFFKSAKKFKEFDKRLKKYPEIYNNSIIATRGIKFHRATGGYLIKFNKVLIKIKNIFRKN